MRLYEFEGMELLRKYNVLTPASFLITEVPSTIQLPSSWNGAVVKAQLLSGKRGKAGVIKRCETGEVVYQAVRSLLHTMVNHEEVRGVLVAEKISIAQQYYVSFIFDTDTRTPMLVMSSSGGIAIEDAIASGAGTIVRIKIDPLLGLQEWNIREAASSLHLSKEQTAKISQNSVISL